MKDKVISKPKIPPSLYKSGEPLSKSLPLLAKGFRGIFSSKIVRSASFIEGQL
jgi:hypothetical protein